MASVAGIAFNNSAHTLNDLKALAQQSPDEATSYLQKAAANLRNEGHEAVAHCA